MIRSMVALPVIAGLLAPLAAGQTAQVGADRGARGSKKVVVDYVGYRAARWEEEQVEEFENKPRNEGGIVYAYLRNASDAPVGLRFWRLNGEDESYWRLNRLIAWDRIYTEQLAPGQTTALELNGITKDFAPGSPFKLGYVGDGWGPVMEFEGALEEDPVQISFIRVLPGLQDLEVFVRHTGEGVLGLEGVTVAGKTAERIEWAAPAIDGRGMGMARVRLAQPMGQLEMIYAGVQVRSGDAARTVMAHRRAFEDYFPIGTWSGGEETYAAQRRMHIDTLVEGGSSTNKFFSELAAKYGLRAMTHSGVIPDVDMLRDLGKHPAVYCWMIQDEPDWSIASNIMLHADEALRRFENTKPSFITLCRNIKFFEYGPIADIPCQDHYSVTAPSSSKWPKPYGTRLEETAWYTRDLKAATEPKPVWVWSQGIADWGERPKRPVPTPNEIAAQLVLNIGRGAKGILWFNYQQSIAERFPDAVGAMRDWGRVMALLRDRFLASEPYDASVRAPEKVDVVAMGAWDAVVLAVTNTDYEIHPEAYPFAPKTDAAIRVKLPAWIDAKAAVEVTPAGVAPLALDVRGKFATVTLPALEAATFIVIANDPALPDALRARYQEALAAESRAF